MKTDRLQVAGALLAVYVVWGSTYLAIRYAIEGFPPLLMAGVRFLIAGAILFTVQRLRGAPPPSPKQWRAALLVGGLLLLGGNGGVVLAEQTVPSALAALAVSTVALWAALFSGLFGEWPRPLEWVGLAVGFAGVVLLNVHGTLRATPLGALALMVATLSWAFGSMWSRRLDLPPGLMAAAAEMLGGGALLVIAGLIVGETPPAAVHPRSLAAIAYLIVFGSLIGYTAYVFLLGRVRASLATSYAYVNPVIAVMLGVGLAGERITATEWVAMPIILAGVALVVLAHNRAAPAVSERRESTRVARCD